MAASAKRVAHVLGPSRGGIRRHVAYIALHPPPGYETAGVWGPPVLGSYFKDVPFTPGSPLRSCPSGADIVHAHGLAAGKVALRPGLPPVVLTVHTDIRTQGRTARSGVLRVIARLIAARANAVIAVSDRVAEAFPDAHVIAPATESLPRPERSRDDVRSGLGTPRERVVVICVARLHRDKGLARLIGAIRGLSADVEAWICGEGPQRAELEAMIAGVPVRLLGQRDDIADLLHAADVFALPSVGEAYGIAVLEALQAGLPVLTTDTGAAREIVGDAGLIVPAADDSAIADALARLVTDGTLRESLAAAVSRRKLPDPDELVRRIGEVYDEVSS